MPDRSTRALIFDIGRVIVRVDLSRAMHALGASGDASAEQVWAAIQADPLWPDWQEGRVAPREWHAHLARRFRLPLSFDEFCEVWSSCLAPETILEQSLFEKLGRRYRLGLLSNTDAIHVAHMEATFGFLSHFPARVYSCFVGSSKPNPAIYRHAVAEVGVPAGQILYIDDEPRYVQAGQQAGMQAILFEGPGKLQTELGRRGILTG